MITHYFSIVLGGYTYVFRNQGFDERPEVPVEAAALTQCLPALSAKSRKLNIDHDGNRRSKSLIINEINRLYILLEIALKSISCATVIFSSSNIREFQQIKRCSGIGLFNQDSRLYYQYPGFPIFF